MSLPSTMSFTKFFNDLAASQLQPPSTHFYHNDANYTESYKGPVDGLCIAIPNIMELTWIIILTFSYHASYSITTNSIFPGDDLSNPSQADILQTASGLANCMTLATASTTYFAYSKFGGGECNNVLRIAFLFCCTIWSSAFGLEMGNGVGRVNKGEDFSDGSTALFQINDDILQQAEPTQWSGDSAQLYEEKLKKQREYVTLAAETDGKIRTLIAAQAELVDFGRKFFACTTIIASGIVLLVTRMTPNMAALADVNPIAGRLAVSNFLQAIGIISGTLIASIVSGILLITSEAALLAKKIESAQLDYEKIIDGVKNNIMPRNPAAIKEISTAPHFIATNFFNTNEKSNRVINKLDPTDRPTDQPDQYTPLNATRNNSAIAVLTKSVDNPYRQKFKQVTTLSREITFADRPNRSRRQLASQNNPNHAAQNIQTSASSNITNSLTVPPVTPITMDPWKIFSSSRHYEGSSILKGQL